MIFLLIERDMIMNTIKMPSAYVEIAAEEMTYLEGGAVATSEAYNTFLNVGKVFNYLARIFSGASSIINNVNVIYQSVVALNDLLAKMF